MKRTRSTLMTFGILLVIAAMALFAVASYWSSDRGRIPLVYSNNAMLYELWNTYKATDLEKGSERTVDHSQPGNITTSEGESYTMLRAVWMDDQPTFDKSLAFSQAYLQRSDHLFSWRYGHLYGNKYGINLTNGNYNTASDGDTDIALALLMAYSHWDDSKYLTAAKPIINSIWKEEVVTIQGRPVLTADNLERLSPTSVVVDPSYFNPAAYKVFAAIDPTHDWKALASNSYTLLQQVSAAKLGSSKSDGLPPNWITINRATGAFIPNVTPALDTNYGYDAFRVPFNLALDYEWYHDARDVQTLDKFGYLKTLWRQHHQLDALYAHDGSSVAHYQQPAMYGASIGYFVVADKADLSSIYRQKLQTLYSPDTQSWKSTLSYYNDNWAWFGLALSQHALPNLTGVSS